MSSSLTPICGLLCAYTEAESEGIIKIIDCIGKRVDKLNYELVQVTFLNIATKNPLWV